MEIVIRVRQYFEHEKHVHRRISLNNITESTAAAIGVNRKLVRKISNIEDVLSWRKLPAVPITVSPTQKNPKISRPLCSILFEIFIPMVIKLLLQTLFLKD